MAVDDALGQAGGARGVEDPQRVVEGDGFEDQLRLSGCGALRTGDSLGPADTLRARRALRELVVDPDGVLDRRQRIAGLHALGAAVDALAAVAVAVDADEDLRLDLREPVQDALRAEVRAAGGPHRADAGRGELRDDRVRGVGQEGRDGIADADAPGAQCGGQTGDLAAQLGPGDLDRLGALLDEQQGRAVVGGGAEDVLGEVQSGAGKPARAGHRRRPGGRRCRGSRPGRRSSARGFPRTQPGARRTTARRPRRPGRVRRPAWGASPGTAAAASPDAAPRSASRAVPRTRRAGRLRTSSSPNFAVAACRWLVAVITPDMRQISAPRRAPKTTPDIRRPRAAAGVRSTSRPSRRAAGTPVPVPRPSG